MVQGCLEALGSDSTVIQYNKAILDQLQNVKTRRWRACAWDLLKMSIAPLWSSFIHSIRTTLLIGFGLVGMVGMLSVSVVNEL